MDSKGCERTLTLLQSLHTFMHADEDGREGELRQSMLKFSSPGGQVRSLVWKNKLGTKMQGESYEQAAEISYVDMSSPSLKADYGFSYSDIVDVFKQDFSVRHADSSKQTADISYQHLVDSVAQVQKLSFPTAAAVGLAYHGIALPLRPLLILTFIIPYRKGQRES
jgi:hypothetical protein